MLCTPRASRYARLEQAETRHAKLSPRAAPAKALPASNSCHVHCQVHLILAAAAAAACSLSRGRPPGVSAATRLRFWRESGPWRAAGGTGGDAGTRGAAGGAPHARCPDDDRLHDSSASSASSSSSTGESSTPPTHPPPPLVARDSAASTPAQSASRPPAAAAASAPPRSPARLLALEVALVSVLLCALASARVSAASAPARKKSSSLCACVIERSGRSVLSSDGNSFGNSSSCDRSRR